MDALSICYGAGDDLLLAARHGERLSVSKQHFYDNSEPEPYAQGRSQLYLMPHTQHELDLRPFW